MISLASRSVTRYSSAIVIQGSLPMTFDPSKLTFQAWCAGFSLWSYTDGNVTRLYEAPDRVTEGVPPLTAVEGETNPVKLWFASKLHAPKVA